MYAVGGYEAIHDYFGTDMTDCIEEHDESMCVVCRDNRPPRENSTALPENPPNRLLGKFSAVLKSKSADIKDKLIEYIVNPAAGEPPKGKKLYRGLQPVFSIDDEDDESSSK